MTTHAFPYQLAQEAILLGRYADAIKLLKPLSQTDHPDAQFLHAYLHFWDDDLGPIEALDRMTYLANSGHAEANYILAICPDLSPGYQFSLPKRDEQLNRLQMAADAGSVYAMTDMAECYLEESSPDYNPEKAYNLLLLAQHTRIQYLKLYWLLGRILVDGLAGEQNLQTGLAYLRMVSGAKADPLSSKALQLALNVLNQLEPETGGFNVSSTLESFKKIQSEPQQSMKPQWELYLHYYCETTLVYDLRDADFDTFTDFVFDHYARRWNDRDSYRWDKLAKVKFDARQLLHYYTALFENPGFLVERFSVDQII